MRPYHYHLRTTQGASSRAHVQQFPLFEKFKDALDAAREYAERATAGHCNRGIRALMTGGLDNGGYFVVGHSNATGVFAYEVRPHACETEHAQP